MPETSDTNTLPASKHFTIDARAMLSWGRDSIKDHTTAALELVKNSYDAGAAIVEVELKVAPASPRAKTITITDDGCGMSEEDVDDKWLRIGFSDKLEHTLTESGRRKTGEKGIGRISADRLGANLELRTQAEKTTAVGLSVNWNEFESAGSDLGEIEIPVLPNPSFLVPRPSKFSDPRGEYEAPPPPRPNTPSRTGTQLLIRSLRQNWSRSDISDLRRELSILVSPFGGVKDFQIRLLNDVEPVANGVVASPFFQAAEIEAHFSYRQGSKIQYSFKDRDKRGKGRISDRGFATWNAFAHRDTNPDHQNLPDEPGFGPVIVHLLFYPRISETLRGTDLSVGELKDFLDRNAGIKVYRDNIRVMPYGDPTKPEGDWLGLGDRKTRSPAGPARKDWRVASNQLVGAVFLSRDKNPAIIDTSGREGLIHGEHFIALKAFLFGCIFRLEAHYHELFVRRMEQEPGSPSPRETVQEFDAQLRNLSRDLKGVEAQLPRGAERSVERVRDKLETTLAKMTVLQRSMEELASQATIYRGLSTLGIASATFGHETEASLEQFMSSAYTACTLLEHNPPALNDAIEELSKAIEFGKRVGAWGAYALRRVKPDKRRRKTVNVTELVRDLLQELKPIMHASNIKVETNLARVEGKTFSMDIESVLINLLTNAYYFCKMKRRPRCISIALRSRRNKDEDGFELVVGDSGPGVSPRVRQQVWEPLFSTKIDRRGRAAGTGLGLSIVDAVVKDIGGTRNVDVDPKLQGARFTVWLKLS